MLDIIAILDAIRSIDENAIIEVYREYFGLRVTARVKIGDRLFSMSRIYRDAKFLVDPEILNSHEPDLFKRKLQEEIKKHGNRSNDCPE